MRARRLQESEGDSNCGGHMEAGKDPKAKINPAARHDAPHEPDESAEPTRTRERQVKPKQGAELNPIDPGGIGD